MDKFKINIYKLTHIYLPILTILYLLVNIFLLFTNKYCNTSGCGATKTILNIEQKELYFLAIFIFIILVILGFLINKKNENKIALKLFNIILFSMLVVETIFISYLYYYTKEFCIICLGFYSLLVINNLLVFKLYNQFQYFLIIPAIVIGLSIIKIENKEVYINKTTLLYDNKNSDKYIELKKKLDFYKYDYNEEKYTEYLNLLNSFNIETLPVMIIKNDDKIIILESLENINKYVK